MFKLDTGLFGDLSRITLFNDGTGERMSIIPEFGGNIRELVLSKKGRRYSILAGARTCSELLRNRWFKGAKLIPFPNRIDGGRYLFDGEYFQMPLNFAEHAIHGFIYDKRLCVIQRCVSSDEAWVELGYSYDGTVPGYPFNFNARIRYSIAVGQGFRCTTVVTNEGKSPMPFGDGWHPYFRTRGEVDDLMIRVPATQRVEVDVRMIPTGRLIPVDHSQWEAIGGRGFDTCFYVGEEKGQKLTEIYDHSLDVTTNVWQETGRREYNYLQVFIPPSRKSIAVEPMTCAPDAFNNKMGLIVLGPGESFEASYGVYLS